MVVHFYIINNLRTNFFGYVHMCPKFLGHDWWARKSLQVYTIFRQTASIFLEFSGERK